MGDNKWILFGGSVLLLSTLVLFLLVNSCIHSRERFRHSFRCPSHLAVHFPSLGRARWVGGWYWRLSRRCHSPKKSFFISFIIYSRRKNYALFSGVCFFCCTLLSKPVTKREPTPGYDGAYSVGTPKWALLEKSGQNLCKTTISPLCKRVFLVNKRTLSCWGDW